MIFKDRVRSTYVVGLKKQKGLHISSLLFVIVGKGTINFFRNLLVYLIVASYDEMRLLTIVL